MSFQNITFKYTNCDTSSSLESIVSQKLSSLEKYVGAETDVRCEVEIQKSTAHKSGPNCRVEVNIWVAGALYRAEASKETFEAAVDAVRDDLNLEMRKANEKQDSLLRRGGRKIKEMMRFGR